MKVVAVVVLCFAVFCIGSAEIGSDLLSTLRIVGKLCLCNHSDSTSAQFYACYDRVPEQKELFSSCQRTTFGNVLDSEAHVTAACRNPLALKKYSDCLKKGSEGNEEALKAAILIVNQCQAAVVGIK